MRIALLVGTATAAVNRPVTRIVNLLKDMQGQLQHEAKTDEETFAKLDCWCKTNNDEKTKSIGVSKTAITDLTNAIQEHAGLKATRETEIEKLVKDLAKAKSALGDATGLREKEADAFYQEHKDLLESIEMLKNAIVVLGKHHGKGLAQVKAVVKHVMWKHADKLSSAARQAAMASLVQIPVHSSYTSQSSEIFGILGDMKETMERDLGGAKKTEDERKAAFAEFKAAKMSEIDSTQESIDTKQAELASSAEKLERAKEDLAGTRDSLAADVQFLEDLTLKCQSTDHEYEQRQKMRNEEIVAVSEAIKILMNDDSKELFGRSVNTPSIEGVSLLQRQSKRAEAAFLLRRAALKSKNAQLSALAVSAQLDAFVKVKKAIDDMVAQLKQEQQDEVKHRDWCNKEFRQNDRSVQKQKRNKSELEIQIGDLQAQIEQLTQEIAAHNQEIAETQVEIKKAGENREAENKDFQATIADQRATQAVLQKAIDRLAVVYQGKRTVSLMQAPEDLAAPAGFNKYDQNAGATGVLQLLENVKSESATTEKDAVQAEQDSQSTYETFVNNANESINALKRQIVAKTASKAASDESLSNAEQDLQASNDDLQALADVRANLHQSCDFLMKNFTTRQQARSEEIEALGHAKSVLSGADMS